jgi:PIN domain nuclease of toxin-antitoxin system
LRLLLDTHVAVWALGSPKRLDPSIIRLIGNARNEVFVSAISVFEIALKRSRTRRSMPDVSATDFRALVERAGYKLLPVTADHAEVVEDLPDIHADPYDRLLVAQALTVPLRLVTHDETIAAYSDTIILF